MLFAYSDTRPVAGGATCEPRGILDQDRRYFAANPQAQSYLRPMCENEFGERAPALPANVPTSAQFYMLIEVQARSASGWPKRLYRRPILVIVGSGHAQTNAALSDRIRGARTCASPIQADADPKEGRHASEAAAGAQGGSIEERGNPAAIQGSDPTPIRKRKRPGGRRSGSNPETWRRQKMSRPLKAAISDLDSLLNDYSFNCCITPDALELSVDATSPASASPWAAKAAERLRSEYRCCEALRRRVLRWAQEQQQEGELT